MISASFLGGVVLAMDRMHTLRHIPVEPLRHLGERSMPTVGVINPFCVADVASDVICIGGKDEAVIVPLDNQSRYGQALHQRFVIELA